MMDSRAPVGVAIALYLLFGTIASLEIGCEVHVDTSHGRCESASSCWLEHTVFGNQYEEQKACWRENLNNALRTNKNMVPHDKPICVRGSKNCNKPGWNVLFQNQSARCSPDVVNVSFHHLDSEFYIAEVYWRYSKQCDHTRNLVGVQVALDGIGLSCSNDGVGGGMSNDCCYCLETNHTAGMEGRYNITVDYIGGSLATARVFSFPNVIGDLMHESYSTTYEFQRLSTCYDPRLPVDLKRCGMPTPDEPRNVMIHTYKHLEDRDEEMNATLSWNPPSREFPEPTVYYVRIQADSSPSIWCSGNTRCFKVINSTQILFTHLNASKTYYVKVGAYQRCSGIADLNNYVDGCGKAVEVELTYVTPTITPTILLTTDEPPSSGNLITQTPTASPTDEPLRSGHLVAVTIAVATCTALLLVAVVVVLVYLLVLCCWKPGTVQYDGIQPPSPISPCGGYCGPSVLVVYSDRTQNKEKDQILYTLLGVLRQERGIQSTCHECFMRGDAIVFQVADKLAKADAVLCVCNPAFYADWNSECPPPVINALKQTIAAEISSGRNLSKYATVFMYARDKRNCIPNPFLGSAKRFMITDLKGIVGFVKNPGIEMLPISKQNFSP